MDNRPTIAEVQEWVLKLYNTCEQTITCLLYTSIGAVPQHGIHEHADTCRRFEHTGGADAVICQHGRDGVGYLFGGVESGQHGRFQRIHKPLVLCFVLAVLTDKPCLFYTSCLKSAGVLTGL